jgi:hypothetical protein
LETSQFSSFFFGTVLATLGIEDYTFPGRETNRASDPLPTAARYPLCAFSANHDAAQLEFRRTASKG